MHPISARPVPLPVARSRHGASVVSPFEMPSCGDSFATSAIPATTGSPAAEATPVHLSAWKVTSLAALSLVPVLGLVGCTSPPPPPAVCITQPVVAERVAVDNPLDALTHFSQQGSRCGTERGVFFDRGFWGEKNVSAADALVHLQKGEPVYVKDSNGKKIVIHDLAELRAADALIGRGHNTILEPAQFAALRGLEQGPAKSDGYAIGGTRANAFQVFQSLQGGHSVSVSRGNVQDAAAASFDDLAIFDGLNGDGTTTFLTSDQVAGLDALYGSHSYGAYTAASAFHRGQPATFSFSGGAFGDNLSIRIDNPEQLPSALQRYQNQQQYDRYRITPAEFTARLGEEAARTPGLTADALSSARSELSSAESLPSTVPQSYTTTEYTYHYGYNFSSGNYEYHYGPETVTKSRDVENTERTRRVRDAESRVSSLETEQQMLKDLDAAVSQSTGSPQDLERLHGVLDRMQNRASDYRLRDNISRLQSLVRGMQERPERPPGWVAPQPRVQG